MAQTDYNKPRFYILELCFACKERMLTPMHRLQPAQLGMPRIHKACFTEDLFARFESDLVVTIDRSDKVLEHVPLSQWPTRDYGVRLVRDNFDPDDDA